MEIAMIIFLLSVSVTALAGTACIVLETIRDIRRNK